MDYVRRCKYKPHNNRADYDAVFKTLHGVNDGCQSTICGKVLNEMWLIERSNEVKIEDITCKKCVKKIKRQEYLEILFAGRV